MPRLTLTQSLALKKKASNHSVRETARLETAEKTTDSALGEKIAADEKTKISEAECRHSQNQAQSTKTAEKTTDSALGEKIATDEKTKISETDALSVGRRPS